MTDSINELNPVNVWNYFREILKIPRPSGKEEKIRKWVIDWAKSNGFENLKDDAGNVVIKIPASGGRESSPVVVLQSHMDMVCEKNEDVNFNFEKDPIEVVIDGEWLKTKGTSMGADNGIGMAVAMAIATDNQVVRGPLEILFTVDEETGLTGAFKLSANLLQGKMMLNLDSEEEGTFFVGCAGGGESRIKFPLTWAKPVKGRKILKIKLTGMIGGHSGLNIHENRANAIKVATRILTAARNGGIQYDLVSIEGGDKHNAIPRECSFEILLKDEETEKFTNLLEEWKNIVAKEYGKTDPEFRFEISEIKKRQSSCITRKCRDKLLALLYSIPHGVIAMSRDIPGLVETSNNLASIRMSKKFALIVTSSRSSVASALVSTREAITEICNLAGAQIEQPPSYPGWQPDMESKLLATAKNVYSAIFGKPPHITAVHAGLECGIVGEKYPGMEMLSIGPTLTGVHSPQEKIHIPSVEKFYTFLKELLKALC